MNPVRYQPNKFRGNVGRDLDSNNSANNFKLSNGVKIIKALNLFSGGLDSILAAKLLQRQNIEVTGLTFVSYFFNADVPQKMADELKLPLKIVNFSDEHLTMVKNPRYGYGKNMNPCLDCHLMMLRKAKEIMEKENFDLVATGEVLGERPFSQNLSALKLLEKESNLVGYLLRPLSAKLLEPTTPEKQGLIERNELLDIQGRSRKRQMALAQSFGINEYPTPAGGCSLTDPGFSQRLEELLKNWSNCQGTDIELLKYGRIFWHRVSNIQNPASDVLIVVGRNQAENQQLEKLAVAGDILIEIENLTGPTTLIRFQGVFGEEQKEQAIKKAEQLTQFYSPKARTRKDVSFRHFLA